MNVYLNDLVNLTKEREYNFITRDILVGSILLIFFNPFGSSKGFFQKIRSHVKLHFWHPCYYFLTQLNRIFIFKDYFITLQYLPFCIQLWTVQSFPLEHVILQEKNSAFSLHPNSIVRSLFCEKAIVFVYSKIVWALYFYQLGNSWTVQLPLSNLEHAISNTQIRGISRYAVVIDF